VTPNSQVSEHDGEGAAQQRYDPSQVSEHDEGAAQQTYDPSWVTNAGGDWTPAENYDPALDADGI
jgi:hypothetical protein